MRIASPERWWRAASTPLIAGVIGWIVSVSVRLGMRNGTSPWLPSPGEIIVVCAAVTIGLWLAALTLRTHLVVSEDGLADHRMFRVVHVSWDVIASFEVNRPQGLSGGYCVVAVCGGGTTIDLLSTRAYSRVPSARHFDELHRICWTLEEVRTAR